MHKDYEKNGKEKLLYMTKTSAIEALTNRLKAGETVLTRGQNGENKKAQRNVLGLGSASRAAGVKPN